MFGLVRARQYFFLHGDRCLSHGFDTRHLLLLDIDEGDNGLLQQGDSGLLQQGDSSCTLQQRLARVREALSRQPLAAAPTTAAATAAAAPNSSTSMYTNSTTDAEIDREAEIETRRELSVLLRGMPLFYSLDAESFRLIHIGTPMQVIYTPAATAAAAAAACVAADCAAAACSFAACAHACRPAAAYVAAACPIAAAARAAAATAAACCFAALNAVSCTLHLLFDCFICLYVCLSGVYFLFGAPLLLLLHAACIRRIAASHYLYIYIYIFVCLLLLCLLLLLLLVVDIPLGAPTKKCSNT